MTDTRFGAKLGVCVAGGILAVSLCAAGLGFAKESGATDVEPTSGLARADITAENWTSDMDCAFCHVVEEASYHAGDAGVDAASQGKVPGDAEAAAPLCALHSAVAFECVDCHSDADALTAVHQKSRNLGKDAKRLRKTEVDTAACASCHNSEDLAAATADLDVLTDAEGTTVNPHDLPQNDSHASVTCFSCHPAHVAEADTGKAAQKACLSCHHENVYTCNTCH